jgi:hypothetical protein
MIDGLDDSVDGWGIGVAILDVVSGCRGGW